MILLLPANRDCEKFVVPTQPRAPSLRARFSSQAFQMVVRQSGNIMLCFSFNCCRRYLYYEPAKQTCNGELAVGSTSITPRILLTQPIMIIVDDPMLALIMRFVVGGEQLGITDESFIQRQAAAIKQYVAQFPKEQEQTRALEWIEEHAKKYRQEWQKTVARQRATLNRCADCPLSDYSPSSRCEVHERWLDLLNRYIANKITSKVYVDQALRLLHAHKARLKIASYQRPGKHLQSGRSSEI